MRSVCITNSLYWSLHLEYASTILDLQVVQYYIYAGGFLRWMEIILRGNDVGFGPNKDFQVLGNDEYNVLQ